MGKFEKKVAIVTGGGSGKGEAIARALAAEQASVVVADIDLAAAERVVDETLTRGGERGDFLIRTHASGRMLILECCDFFWGE